MNGALTFQFKHIFIKENFIVLMPQLFCFKIMLKVELRSNSQSHIR